MQLRPSGNPRVIGATGGSGTRVMARLTHGRGGAFIGTLLNEFEDAINIGLFLNDWIPPYIESEHRGVPMLPDRCEEMAQQFREALARHLEPMADRGGPYGWKERTKSCSCSPSSTPGFPACASST